MFCFTSALPAGWMRLWPFLEIESLSPVERDAFIRELGLAWLIRYAQLLILCIAVLLAATAIHHRSTIDAWRAIGLSVSTVTCVMVLVAGCGLWLMRYRKATLALLLGWLSQAPYFALLWFASSARETLLLSGLFALAGVVILWDAYRRWLQTEWG
jgi:hypothetical protein